MHFSVWKFTAPMKVSKMSAPYKRDKKSKITRTSLQACSKVMEGLF